MVTEKNGLGRGLDALIGGSANGEDGAAAVADAEVPLDRLQHNPFQPRKNFDAEDIASLGASIRSHGILQPLVVRQVGDQYQIIAGERRLRAAQEVGLTTVPVRIVDFNDQQTLEAALIENIQRADLNPIEKAHGFKDYLDRFHMTQEHLAQRLGVARSTITNLITLLELAPEVQGALRVNQITEAHAKLLKSIKDPAQQVAIYRQIVGQGLSVKATDQLVRQKREETAVEEPEPQGKKQGTEKTAHVRGLEDELRQKLSTAVEIRLREKDRGQIILRFESNDDFMRLMDCLRR